MLEGAIVDCLQNVIQNIKHCYGKSVELVNWKNRKFVEDNLDCSNLCMKWVYKYYFHKIETNSAANCHVNFPIKLSICSQLVSHLFYTWWDVYGVYHWLIDV